jgi:transcriptional regulator with XRE-family HTH domain
MRLADQAVHPGLRTFRALVRQSTLSQEDFDDTSSRTYISAIERGVKTPTIAKICELAEAMDLHPLTVLILSYSPSGDRLARRDLLTRVATELDALGL